MGTRLTIQTTVFIIDKQQGYTVRHREIEPTPETNILL